MSRWPGHQSSAGAVDGSAPARGHGGDDACDIGRVHAPEPGHRALGPRRQPFDLPLGKEEIGKRRRAPPEHPPDALHHAADAIEMEDVRVFVREHDAQPVVVVPEEGGRRRRNRGNLDQVVRDGRGPSVGDVRLIHEDHVRVRRRIEAGAPGEIVADTFGNRGEARRHGGFALVIVDGEVGRAKDAEPELRVVAAGREAGRRGDDERGRAQRGQGGSQPGHGRPGFRGRPPAAGRPAARGPRAASAG